MIRKIKISFLLTTFLVSIVAANIGFLLAPATAGASRPPGDGSSGCPKNEFAFIDGNGNTDCAESNNPTFELVGPYTAQDVLYADNTPYTTTATGYLADHSKLGTAWYWPNGQYPTQDSNDNCAAGLAVGWSTGGGTSTYLVQPKKGAGTPGPGGSCVVYDPNNNLVSQSNLEGWQSGSSGDLMSGSGFINSQQLYTLEDGNSPISERQAIIQFGATFLDWQSSDQIQVIPNLNVPISKLSPTDPAYKTLMQNVDNHQFKSGYDVFANETSAGCLVNGLEVGAGIFVKQGHPETAYLFYRHSNGSYDTSSFYGHGYECLTGANLGVNPAGEWGGSESSDSIKIGDVANASSAGGSGSGGGNGGGSASTPACENSGFALSWIFCSIIEGLASAVDGTYEHIIAPMLRTKPLVLTDSPNDPAHTYAVWSSFRIYANIILILVLLIIVFGQALGGG